MDSPGFPSKIWRSILVIFITCLLAITESATNAAPAVQTDEAGINFWLGPYLDIWMGDIHPSHDPAIAYNSLHDEFLVVWVVDQDNYTHNLWARRVKTDGSMPSWFCLLNVEGFNLNYPSLAYNPTADEYLVVFGIKLSDTDNDIWGIPLRWDGGIIYNYFPINQNPDIEIYPSVSYNSQQNQYLVAYEEQNSDDRITIGLNLLDGAGGWLSYSQIPSLLNEHRCQPEVVYNPTRNQYLVTYSYNLSYLSPSIKSRLIKADLTDVIASAEQTLDNPEIDAINAQATSGNDEFLVSWSRIDSTSWDIYARRLNENGVPQSEIFPIATGKVYMHSDGDMAFRPGIGYLNISSYTDFTAGAAVDTYLRFAKPGQDQAFGPEYPLDTSPGDQEQPVIACNPQGACLAAYTDFPPSSSAPGIRGRVIGFGQIFMPLLRR